MLRVNGLCNVISHAISAMSAEGGVPQDQCLLPPVDHFDIIAFPPLPPKFTSAALSSSPADSLKQCAEWNLIRSRS